MRRLALGLGLGLVACGSSSADSGSGLVSDSASDSASDSGGGCALTASTSPTSTVTDGCALLARDTSACNASRVAAGLSGAWLEFSCRVTLSKTGDGVVVVTDDRPDHASNYFPTSDPCWTAFTPAFPDPNVIAAQSMTLAIPSAPAAGVQAMGLGAVGVALDGVAIFDNQAAPGDDIFTEAKSFDACQGHPAPGGVYHYHSEPYSISHDDAALVGVLRDGYFVYGRRDADGTTPSDLDAAGGHTGTTPHSTTPVYHHHVVAQTSTTPGTAGETQYFLTTGKYAATPGACTGCR